VEALIKDLREYVIIVKNKKPLDTTAIRTMITAAVQSPDPEAAFGQLAASAGLTSTELPTEMAFINEILDALPDEMCNVFLVNYFNDLYV
jgi:sphinganine-1-phosphate aldolase